MSTVFLCGTKLCPCDLKSKKETSNTKMHLTDQCCSGENNDRQGLHGLLRDRLIRKIVCSLHLRRKKEYHRRKPFSENVNGNF